jgi:hypothetical protein
LLPIDHRYPHYGSRSRKREVIMALNSLTGTALLTATGMLLENVALNGPTFLAGGVALVILYGVQFLYARFRFARAEKKALEVKEGALFGSYILTRI